MGQFRVVITTLAAVVGGALIGFIGMLWIALALLVDVEWGHYGALGYGPLALAVAVIVAIVTGCIGAVIGYGCSTPARTSPNKTREPGPEDLTTRYQTRLRND